MLIYISKFRSKDGQFKKRLNEVFFYGLYMDEEYFSKLKNCMQKYNLPIHIEV